MIHVGMCGRLVRSCIEGSRVSAFTRTQDPVAEIGAREA